MSEDVSYAERGHIGVLTHDREGVRSFLEKREPHYVGG